MDKGLPATSVNQLNDALLPHTDGSTGNMMPPDDLGLKNLFAVINSAKDSATGMYG